MYIVCRDAKTCLKGKKHLKKEKKNSENKMEKKLLKGCVFFFGQALERELNEKEEAFFKEKNKNDQVSHLWPCSHMNTNASVNASKVQTQRKCNRMQDSHTSESVSNKGSGLGAMHEHFKKAYNVLLRWWTWL